MTDHTRHDLTETEDALRRALARDAARIAPPERLGAILREAHRPPAAVLADEPLPDAPPARRTWLAAGAAAAAVAAAVAVGVAVADRGGTALPGGTGTSTVPTGPATGTSATGPTSGPSTPGSGTGTGSGTTTTGALVALPVYYVGHRAGAASAAALVREFVPTDLGGDRSPTTRVARAVVTALQAVGTPYAAVSPGRVAASVTALSPSGIEVGLSTDTGRIALTPIQQASVVYTAQAAAALGDVPVAITVNPNTFGPLGRLGPFVRKDLGDVLAPIWVNAPFRGQVYPAGRAITVTGLASVFEAQFSWEVRRGGTVVAGGSAKAAGGAPARAAYTISFHPLPAGSYTLRLFEPAAKGDGSLSAEVTTTFTVR